MFRVSQRGSPPPVVAPLDRTTWHGTLTARPEPAPARTLEAPTNGTLSNRLRIAPWESVPAPWDEAENPVPYVVITTQPWPEEWWRAGPRDTPSNGSKPHPLTVRQVPSGINVIPVRARPRARARRRGLFTRLAIFAVALLISLIAVETASRRRS